MGRGKRQPSSSFLNRHQLPLSAPPSDWGQKFFFVPPGSSRDCHGMMEKLFQVSVQWGSFILKYHLSITYCFYVCGEHVLRIIKPLSSLDRMLVSYHHCFIFWEHVLWFLCMVLLLSKLAWFCGSADPLSWVIINFRGLPHFFSIYNPLVGLTGLPWWPKW